MCWRVENRILLLKLYNSVGEPNSYDLRNGTYHIQQFMNSLYYPTFIRAIVDPKAFVQWGNNLFVLSKFRASCL